MRRRELRGMLHLWGADVHWMSGGDLQLGDWDAHVCNLCHLSQGNILFVYRRFCLRLVSEWCLFHGRRGPVGGQLHPLRNGEIHVLVEV